MGELGTVGAVKALVYDTVFKRAQEIAASDKLRGVVFDGESLLKGTAECIGSSASDVYALSVSIDGAGAVGNCSCPAGKSAKSGLCKHVVALLLRRVQETQIPNAMPSTSASEEELTVPIASQIDDIAPSQEARKSSGRGAPQSSISRGNDTRVPNSKRALPAWMLGVAGSAAAEGESSIPPKSKKRVAAPKPPRPKPPPTKRARRSGHPLRISNDSDEGDQDPGEVEDAGPVQESSDPAAVEDDDDVAEPIILPTEGSAARERRRLRALKTEEAAQVGRNTRIEAAEKPRGRGRSVTKAVEVPPVRASKRRRLVKKVVEEDSDVSENECAPVEVDGENGGNGLCLTDDDLVLLAQEELEREKIARQAEDLRLKAELSKVTKPPEKHGEGKKSSSIFSMDKWKDLSSAGARSGGALSMITDDLDSKPLKSYSLGPSSHSFSHVDKPLDLKDAASGLLPSLQVSEAATGLSDIPSAIIATGCDETDAVANDMLSIMFGPKLSQDIVVKNVAAASSTPSSLQGNLNCSTVAAEVVAPVAFSSSPEKLNFASTNPAAVASVDDLGVQSKPKKKSSLKDKVKMYLS